MSDYIKRKDVVDWISKVETLMPKCVLEEIINKIPAADVIEVVRCKDCKWFNNIGCAIQIVDDSDKPKENDYCSYGERAEQ